MKKLVLLVIIASIIPLTMSAQKGTLEFKDKSVSEYGHIIKFSVLTTNNNINIDKALNHLLENENIIDGKYYYSTNKEIRFQLHIIDISAEEIRDILLENNLDYNFNSILVDGTSIDDNNKTPSNYQGSVKEPVTSDGFPQYINSGNKDLDEQNYKNEKDKWINENPEKYQKLLNDIENK